MTPVQEKLGSISFVILVTSPDGELYDRIEVDLAEYQNASGELTSIGKVALADAILDGLPSEAR